MQRRWLVGMAVIVAGSAIYVATREEPGPRPTPQPVAQTAREIAPLHARRAAAPTRDVVPGRVYLPPGLSDPMPLIPKWKEPGLPGTFRAFASRSGGENVEEKLRYKQRRLRFRLADAAADCYSGPDSKEQISLSYTQVVKAGVLTVENLEVLQSNISDVAVQECIVDAVRNTTSEVGAEIPDVRKPDVRTSISLHDLWRRNRSVD